MAYAAYRRYVARHGEPPVIDGLTGDQRFFLAFAQAWRSNVREGALRAARADRSAQPARIAGQRRRPQRRRLVPRLQHPARRPPLSAARAARPHLVDRRRSRRTRSREEIYSMRHKLLLTAALLLAGTAPLAAQQRPAARYAPWGVDLATRDLAVKPGDDFNRYANGVWLRNTEIPADRTSWSLWTVALRGDRAAASRHRHRGRRLERSGAAQGRRFLRRLDGRGRDRGARRRAAASLSPADRRRSATATT